MRTRAGFTLIEILVAISIVGILMTIITVNVLESGKKSRDAERKADLRTLQSAIELYKGKYGRYPARCASATTWSGEIDTNYECTDGGNQYIVGLAPEFIPALPKDPKRNGTNSGYVYTVNAEGTVYKLMVKRTVESEIVTYTHPFKSCDMSGMGQPLCSNTSLSLQPPDPPGNLYCDRAMCDQVFSGGGLTVQSHCDESNVDFRTTYAVWGGYATANTPTDVARATEDIVCEIP